MNSPQISNHTVLNFRMLKYSDLFQCCYEYKTSQMFLKPTIFNTFTLLFYRNFSKLTIIFFYTQPYSNSVIVPV